MVYAREYAGEKYIVVLNPSAQRATAQFPEEGAVADIVYGSGVPARYTVRKDLASVKAEPVSATVLRMKWLAILRHCFILTILFEPI